MKWIVRICLAALLVLGSPLEASTRTWDLTLLHVNDIYEISPKRGRGGLAPLMTLLKHERAKAKYHLTSFGGGLISPSVMSGLIKGRQMIELFNLMGIDAAGLGNHEFDFGPEILRERLANPNFPGWPPMCWVWMGNPSEGRGM